MVSWRRFLAMVSLMFWQGGFLFYTAVVVPVGTDVLGSAADQGWITRRVTVWLNGAGVAALGILGWDVFHGRHRRQNRTQLRGWIWLFLATTLGLLFWLHARLEALLDAEHGTILNRAAFRAWHSVYLWVSTAQWVAGLAILWWTLQAWKDASEDTCQ